MTRAVKCRISELLVKSHSVANELKLVGERLAFNVLWKTEKSRQELCATSCSISPL